MTHLQKTTMSTPTSTLPHLTGLLRLVSSQCTNLVHFNHRPTTRLTGESHAAPLLLQNRRRRKRQSNLSLSLSREASSFEELCSRHRYVCFFVVQEGNPSHFCLFQSLSYASKATGAEDDVMTTYVITLGNDDTTGKSVLSRNWICMSPIIANVAFYAQY